MVWQPQHWTSVQLEERRLAAARLLRAGKLSQAEIARHIGVSRAAVTHWKQRLEQQGLRGLRRHPSPGRPSHLTAAQWRQLLRILARGAVVAGFDTERWTLRRIAAVIQRRFGVRYHCRWLGAALRARGWSPQQPLPRARERDEALVAAWLRRELPPGKKGVCAPGGAGGFWARTGAPFVPASGPPSRPPVH